jgi:hypothetical protein
MSTVSINLNPVPGFCIKSSTLQPSVYTPSQPKSNLLEPKNASIPISIGHKVFVNIAWDYNVPAPPEGSEDAIQRAMKGEDVNVLNPDGWYVPVVVSEGRRDKDKGTLIFSPDTISSSPIGDYGLATHSPIYHHPDHFVNSCCCPEVLI